MKYHLQGMGVVGCGLAWFLHKMGREFTWSDTDAPHTAWRACTGTIYPSGEDRDQYAWHIWRQWIRDPKSPYRFVTEEALYWYCTKAAPHGYKLTGVPSGQRLSDTVGPLKLHEQVSFHLNAQRFVEWTREQFLPLRMAGFPTGDQLIISHGFNERAKRYLWGWSQHVELDTSALGPERHCLYLRQGRFIMAYAYPIPGTNLHYAGSTLLVQSEPRKRMDFKDVERWKANFTKLSDGLIPIKRMVGDVVQGWRPSTGSVADESKIPLWTRREDGALVVMPMWHSGVRWLPLVLKEFPLD
jgi:hypothetical protein